MSIDGTAGRRIAVVRAPGEKDPALEHLLADLAETAAVYARLAGMEPLRLMDGAEGAAGCDAVLLASSCGERVSCPAAASGAPVYALCVLDGEKGDEPEAALARARQATEAAGGRWMGGVVVADGAFALAAASSARMGTLRRGASEAVDRLILALLAQREAGEAVVYPPRPRWLWRLVAGAR